MKKDSLKFQRARKPNESLPLSSVVRVKDFTREFTYRIGSCVVRFDHCEMLRIGKEMPRGISRVDPAFIEVEIYENVYGIFCTYYLEGDGNSSTLLYKTETKPAWLKEVKYNAPSKTKK